jgi:hypothetical protein
LLFVQLYLFNRAPHAEVCVEKQRFAEPKVKPRHNEEDSVICRIAVFRMRFVGARLKGSASAAIAAPALQNSSRRRCQG